MPPTVLYFTDSRSFGGSEQVLLTIIAGLDRQRWKPVLIFHPEAGLAPLVEKARNLNVKVWTVPRIGGRRAIVHLLQLVQRLRHERPAIFHANMSWPLSCMGGLIAAALARVPAVVATEHLPMTLPGLRWRLAERFISTVVDRYIAVSNHIGRRLREDLCLPDGKIKLVHNGIPEAFFNPTCNRALPSTLTGPIERPMILTVARLDAQKGHRYLIEAVALVPKAFVMLVGDGPERPLLEAQVKALGLGKRITFLGFRDDVRDLLAICDLFVLPSLYEGLPLSILEAMAVGKPVIATAIGGNDEVIVHGETGLLVRPADPTALAAAIQTVLSDPVLGRKLGRAAKTKVCREFSAETMVQQVTQVYDELFDANEEQRRAG